MNENDDIIRDENDFETIRPADKFRSERKSRQTKKNDFLTKIIIVQLIVCAIPVVAVAVMKYTSPSSFQSIKNSFEIMMQNDMSVSEVFAKVKEFSQFPRISEDESVTDEKTTVQDKTTDNYEEVLGTGGDDITTYAAASGTSFSPFYVSSPICVPVSGKISSGFGYRINPVTGVWSFHTGVDISADTGTRIKAAFYGIVEQTGYDDISGNYVVLMHDNGLKTRYLHCSKILVSDGNVIRSGETVALVGSTGRSTGPHLHFTIEINGIKVNPLYIMKLNENMV